MESEIGLNILRGGLEGREDSYISHNDPGKLMNPNVSNTFKSASDIVLKYNELLNLVSFSKASQKSNFFKTHFFKG
jgi:hypothetical protein